MIDDYSKRSRLFHYEQAEQEVPASPFGIEIVRYRRLDVFDGEDFCLHSDLVSLDDTGSPFVYFIREDIFDSWDQHPEPDVTISLRKYLGYRV
jgi:hypothetical protein